MKDRIQQLIDYKEISPGDLAEILNVQRSNISHILNGRNKPGAVFIEKLLHAFPEINARWLMTGEGLMVLNPLSEQVPDASRPFSEPGLKTQLPPLPEKKKDSPSYEENTKTIDKIVLLYSDGTFTYYTNH